MGRFRFCKPADAEDTSTGWRLIAAGTGHKHVDGWREAQQAVSEVLECDHVAVLTGLGTSLCIPLASGPRLFPTMAGLWARAEAEVTPAVLKEVREQVHYDNPENNIEVLLSRCQMALELKKDAKIDDFVKKVEKVIRTACRPTLAQDATSTHEVFLRKLTRRAGRVPRPSIFTTNYDLCFETAAARVGIPVIDGFGFSGQSRFQPDVFDHDIVTGTSYSREPGYIPRVVRLFKLHGSVDWHRVGTAFEKDDETESPVLIYPRSGKYSASYEPPFLEMMGRFLACLRQRNVGLVVCCFGFNDKHIAEPVLAAVKSNPSLKVVVCAPDLSEAGAKELSGKDAKSALAFNHYLGQLDHLESNGDTRITFLSGKFPDLTHLMPDVLLQTDAAHHEARIQALETWVASQSTPGGNAG